MNGSQCLHDRTALFVLHLAQAGKPALALCNGEKSFFPSASTKHEVGFPMTEGCTCHTLGSRSSMLCPSVRASVALIHSGSPLGDWSVQSCFTTRLPLWSFYMCNLILQSTPLIYRSNVGLSIICYTREKKRKDLMRRFPPERAHRKIVILPVSPCKLHLKILK